jgi:hypothetical protein
MEAAMQPNHLKSLQASGVWPEGWIVEFPPEPINGRAILVRRSGGHAREADELRSAIIVAMLDRLPDGWSLSPFDGGDCREWCVSSSQGVSITENPDKFLALYAALVAAGIVKEEV